MIGVSVRANLKPLQRAFIDLRAKQAPFATALALTSLAKGVQAAERDELGRTFDKPTPFTLNAMAVQPATKSRPIAIVFPKDVAEQYLAPYVDGGARSLGSKRAMLVPIGARTNAYGNLSRGQLARLKGKPNVFVGSIKTKGGKTLSGVWQRPTGRKAASAGAKLLIAFAATTPAPKHLAFYERAQACLRANAAREFDTAMRRALATSRR